MVSYIVSSCRLLSLGLTPYELSNQMWITLGTVKQYMVLARHRAECRTTAQLVAEYVRRVECPAQSATPTTNS